MSHIELLAARFLALKKSEKKIKKCRGWFGDLNGGTKGPKKIIARWLRPPQKKSKLIFEITDRFPRV